MYPPPHMTCILLLISLISLYRYPGDAHADVQRVGVGGDAGRLSGAVSLPSGHGV